MTFDFALRRSLYIRLAALGTLTMAFLSFASWMSWSSAPMKCNSAVCFGLSALAMLWAQARGPRAPQTLALASVAGVIAIATLLEYVLQMPLGLDEFLVVDVAHLDPILPPGRPPPTSVVCFSLLTLSFVTDRFATPLAVAIGQFGVVIVLFSALQALTGAALGTQHLFGANLHTQVPVLSAAAFAVLATAKLMLYGERGQTQVLTSPTPTARLTRYVLLATIAVPLLVKWLSLIGYRHHGYDIVVAELIQTLGVTATMALIVSVTGHALSVTEAECFERARALAASEERFRALVGVTAEMVWRYGPDGRPVVDSPSWRAYTGQSEADWRDARWLECVHPHDRASASAVWADARANPRPFRNEFRVRHHDGTYRWMIARVTPLFDGEGHLREWIGMNVDIHERKAAECALRRAKDEAERANAVKSTFLANMSHEIRTPLGAVLGFAELCAEDDVAPPDRRVYADAVRRNGAQLSTLISDILDLSKVEAGELRLTPERIRPAEVAREVLGNFGPQATRNQVELRLTGAWSPEVVTDPVRLRQILTNLISNAVKFTERGAIDVRCATSGDAFIYRITDSGRGIPAALRERIFEAFVQGDPSSTRRYGGTGLGLALSRDLARVLGGDLWLESSEVGRGSTFTLRIPTALPT